MGRKIFLNPIRPNAVLVCAAQEVISIRDESGGTSPPDDFAHAGHHDIAGKAFFFSAADFVDAAMDLEARRGIERVVVDAMACEHDAINQLGADISRHLPRLFDDSIEGHGHGERVCGTGEFHLWR